MIHVDDLKPLAALAQGKLKADQRAQDFTIPINTLQIFEEYYNLFSL